MYHRMLRVLAAVFALLLVFASGLINETTVVLTKQTTAYLANVVGATASVEPTELNRITAALTSKEQELNQREAVLREREIAVSIDGGGDYATGDTTTYLLAAILFILLVLILLNYALDYLRARELTPTQTV